LNLVDPTLAMILAGSEWLERKIERAASINPANAEAAARRDAEWEAGQPALILGSIEAAGTTLTMGKPKGILTTGADISAEHVELLRQYRPDIRSILAERQSAAVPRPVV